MSRSIKYFVTCFLALFLLFTEKPAVGQQQEVRVINWAEWNFSVGYITTSNLFGDPFNSKIYSQYTPAQNDGISFTLMKPLGRHLTAGIEMSELRLEGERLTLKNQFGIWLWPESYETSIRSFDLCLRYHPVSHWFAHPYLNLNAGLRYVNARYIYPGISWFNNANYPYNTNFEKTNNADFNHIYLKYGVGITWNLGPMLSFDTGINFSKIPEHFLYAIKDSRDNLSFNQISDFVRYGQITVKITSHSDVVRLLKTITQSNHKQFKVHEYLPFYRIRKRKGV